MGHSDEEGTVSDPDVKAVSDPDVKVDEGSQSAGQCTLEDEAEMKKLGGGSGEGSFPEVLADCGRKAYSWFRWKRDKMEKCVRKAAKISAPCTKCFSAAGQYGYNKCKSQCLFGDWCSERCLGCTGKHDAHTEACVGADVGRSLMSAE